MTQPPMASGITEEIKGLLACVRAEVVVECRAAAEDRVPILDEATGDYQNSTQPRTAQPRHRVRLARVLASGASKASPNHA
jgi:hypothetical protein